MRRIFRLKRKLLRPQEAWTERDRQPIRIIFDDKLSPISNGNTKLNSRARILLSI